MVVSAVSGAHAQSASASKNLADNFETFLTLLTTQLKNQDPLEPLDSNEFTAQLVQFTSVEQSIQTNQLLESLVALQSSNSANAAVSYLGKEVTAEGMSSRLSDGSASWNYSLPFAASETKLTITDVLGRAVYTTDGEIGDGDHRFTWDGNDANGSPLPDGTYNLVVTATDVLGNEIETATEVTGIVRSVSFQNGFPILDIDGVDVSLGDVLAIVEPTDTGA